MMTTPVQEQYILYYVIILISSIFITWLSIPSHIQASHSKIQHAGIPRSGFVAIFIGFIITLLLWDFSSPIPVNYLLTTCVILLTIVIKDELLFIQYDIKFFVAFIASLILIIPGNIHKLQDVLGYYELPYFPSVILSVLIIMFFINTFNLTDGINRLAATTSIMLNSTFSALCIHIYQYELAAVSLVFVGAVSGFLKVNLAQPKYGWVYKHPSAFQKTLCS